MGFKTMTASVEESSIDTVLNRCQIRPTLTTERATPAAADPGAEGRKPTAWSDFGYTPSSTDTATNGGFDAETVDLSGGVRRSVPADWGITFESTGGANAAYIDSWVTGGTSIEVLQDATPVNPTSYGGETDRTLLLRFWATDDNDEDGAYTPPYEAIQWGDLSDGDHASPAAGEGLVYYKVRAGVPWMPYLAPTWAGATSLFFDFPLNPQTRESVGSVYLRWKKGTGGGTDVWDGQELLTASARGMGALWLETTITGLSADTTYSVWTYISRDTNGATETVGPVTEVQTELVDSYTFGRPTIPMSISSSPRSARFKYEIPVYRMQRAIELVLPATWVEVIKESDHATYGWDADYILRSTSIGPFYPKTEPTTYVDGSSLTYYVNVGLTTRAAGARGTSKGVIGGNLEITNLTQSTSYRWRVAVDLFDGIEYPLTGTFQTPDFDASRQTISTTFVRGIY